MSVITALRAGDKHRGRPQCTLESSAVHHFLFAAVCATLILWGRRQEGKGLTRVHMYRVYTVYSIGGGGRSSVCVMCVPGAGQSWTLVTGHRVQGPGPGLRVSRPPPRVAPSECGRGAGRERRVLRVASQGSHAARERVMSEMWETQITQITPSSSHTLASGLWVSREDFLSVTKWGRPGEPAQAPDN